jgi:8-oxo-dGTP pyrophosphatase MutT (NUDIX family)
VGKDTQQKTTVLTHQSSIVREFSAGGVVYRKVKGKGQEIKVLWLVAKNAPSDLYPNEIWRLQKGWIDDRDDGKHPGPISSGEVKATESDLQTGAIREVREEGGVIAKIIKKIGTTKYFLPIRHTLNSTRGRVMKFVTFYLMEYTSDASEGFCFETSEILWLPITEAIQKVTHTNEKEILKKASELLNG